MSNNTNTAQPEKSKGSFWVFLIPSLIGLFLFMAPISYDGDLTIPVAVLAKSIQALFGDALVPMITMIIVFMSIASVLTKLIKPLFIVNHSFLNGLFNPSLLWLAVRVIGGVAVLMTFFQFGIFTLLGWLLGNA